MRPEDSFIKRFLISLLMQVSIAFLYILVLFLILIGRTVVDVLFFNVASSVLENSPLEIALKYIEASIGQGSFDILPSLLGVQGTLTAIAVAVAGIYVSSTNIEDVSNLKWDEKIRKIDKFTFQRNELYYFLLASVGAISVLCVGLTGLCVYYGKNSGVAGMVAFLQVSLWLMVVLAGATTALDLSGVRLKYENDLIALAVMLRFLHAVEQRRNVLRGSGSGSKVDRGVGVLLLGLPSYAGVTIVAIIDHEKFQFPGSLVMVVVLFVLAYLAAKYAYVSMRDKEYSAMYVGHGGRVSPLEMYFLPFFSFFAQGVYLCIIVYSGFSFDLLISIVVFLLVLACQVGIYWYVNKRLNDPEYGIICSEQVYKRLQGSLENLRKSISDARSSGYISDDYQKNVEGALTKSDRQILIDEGVIAESHSELGTAGSGSAEPHYESAKKLQHGFDSRYLYAGGALIASGAFALGRLQKTLRN